MKFLAGKLFIPPRLTRDVTIKVAGEFTVYSQTKINVGEMLIRRRIELPKNHLFKDKKKSLPQNTRINKCVIKSARKSRGTWTSVIEHNAK